MVVTEWLVALSTSGKTLWFYFVTISLKPLFKNGLGHPCLCLVSIRCSLNAWGCGAVTKCFNFSPVALEQKITLNLSLDSFPRLHFFPFLIEAFSEHLSIKQSHLVWIKLISWWVFIYYLVQFWFPAFNSSMSTPADPPDRNQKLMWCHAWTIQAIQCLPENFWHEAFVEFPWFLFWNTGPVTRIFIPHFRKTFNITPLTFPLSVHNFLFL